MLSQAMYDRLNQQIALEDYSSKLYLAMSSWCAARGHDGAASFMKGHSAEESSHMLKLFDYVNETGGQATISACAAPKADFQDLKDVFTLTLEHEKSITRSINELVDAALSEKDYSSFNFLQWYVSEQHEEEKLFKHIVDMISIIGLDGRGLFMVDREIGKLLAS